MPKKYIVKLSNLEKEELKKLLKSGENKSRVLTRARILLLSDKSKKQQEISEVLDVSRLTIINTCKKYLLNGLIEEAIYDKKRPGRPKRISGKEEAKIIALACSKAPDGYERWSLRLLANKSVELGLIESISHRKVRDILKKTN